MNNTQENRAVPGAQAAACTMHAISQWLQRSELGHRPGRGLHRMQWPGHPVRVFYSENIAPGLSKCCDADGPACDTPR